MTDTQLAKEIAAQIRAEHTSVGLPFRLEKGEAGLRESKVGGVPYLPRDMEWPLDRQGVPLRLLAQVDCAALSALSPHWAAPVLDWNRRPVRGGLRRPHSPAGLPGALPRGGGPHGDAGGGSGKTVRVPRRRGGAVLPPGGLALPHGLRPAPDGVDPR